MKKFSELSLKNYLDELSSEAPVPGGGSVAAYVISLAMGLTQMVGRVSLKRKMKAGLSPEDEKKELERRETIQNIIDAVEKTKKDAFQIVDLDPEVYEQVLQTSGDAQKMEDVLENAFRLQADLAFLGVMAREFNANMAGLVSGSIKNDLLVSAELLKAGFMGAYDTAMINVKYMKQEDRKKRAEQALGELKSRFEKGPSL